jgi:hypothetical protein
VGLEVVGNCFSRCHGCIKIESTAVLTAFHITDNTFGAPEDVASTNLYDAIYISNTNTVYGGLISDNIFCNSGFSPYVKFRYGVNVADARMKNLIIGTMSDQTTGSGAVSAFGTAAIKDTGSIPQTIPRVLATTAVSASNTGNLNDTILATITVPAHAMGLNGRIRVTAMFGKTGTAGTANNTIYFGGTLVFFGVMGATSLSNRVQIDLANRGALNSQVAGGTGSDGFGPNTNPWVFPAVNTAADVTLLIRGQLANAADTIILDSYLVELIPG